MADALLSACRFGSPAGSFIRAAGIANKLGNTDPTTTEVRYRSRICFIVMSNLGPNPHTIAVGDFGDRQGIPRA